MNGERPMPPLVKIERHDLDEHFGIIGHNQRAVSAEEEILENNILKEFLVVENEEIIVKNELDLEADEQPPPKLRKLNIDNSQETSELVEKVENLNREIHGMRAEMSILIDMVATQTTYIQQLLAKTQAMNDAEVETFPIRNEAHLMEVNLKISLDNRQDFITKIKGLLIQAPISRSLKKVMAEDIILAYNMDGVSNKKSLRTYANFVSVLLEAIQITDETQPAEKILRNAMACVKNSANKSKMRKSRAESANLEFEHL
ncbi:uncharacterized protein LOC111518519 [Drosophila willistoni]|uniref:uncharacterized protein LOC111518519 n=1 Tax=Drosophila willistoni TaxID=7260 RepID=UPI000C26C6D1|nr:uncharacterized protein LOC111518519 [Drosophila willistoni]